MPRTRIRVNPADVSAPSAAVRALRERFAAIRAALGIADPYPGDADREAASAAEHGPTDPPVRDLTDLPFITLDPPGSMDLDQAMHLSREGGAGGAAAYRIRYAIADVPAFVSPGGPLDAETRRRGQTMYCPDQRVPLHPAVLSEGAASLLPGTVRPAFVWDLRLDREGALVTVDLERAWVRSVERFDYEGVQRALDSGSTDERFVLLREIGEARIRQEQMRGGASLPMPEQEVHEEPDGGFALTLRPPRRTEDWNAQISLLTGMAAAQIMLDGGVGLLRTMPPPAPNAVERFRRQARALGTVWPEGMAYGDFIRGLDRSNPRQLALIHFATGLFRGAGYTAFDGVPPEQRVHAAVAAPYAHVTAPLRRLVDRFGLVICEALVAGREIPEWVREALPTLPEAMTLSDRRARAVDRACSDATEAAVLSGRVGEVFDGALVDQTEKGMVVQFLDLPVIEVATGQRTGLGAHVRVRLESADVAAGRVRLVRV